MNEIETLAEEVHKLYCEQYEKDYLKSYWTGGDYSKLDERTKEYDRNIARFILEREETERSRISEMLGQAGSLAPIDEWTAGYHGALSDVRERLLKPTRERCNSSPHCSHNTNGRDLSKPCSIAFPDPVAEGECCEKCYSTYTEKDWPAHTTHDACINQVCPCHTPKEVTPATPDAQE